MKLEFDILDNEFKINGQSAREFYVEARQASGISIGTLQNQIGVNHPTLYNLEHKSKGKYNNSLEKILAGLEGLGYKLEISK